MKNYLLLTLLILLSSCFQTAEDIRKEKLLFLLEEQMGQTQTLIAQLKIRQDELEKNILSMNGKIEELYFYTKKTYKKGTEKINLKITESQEQIGLLLDSRKKNERIIKKLNKQLKNQKKFIKDITNTLVKEDKKRTPKSSFQKADIFYSQKKFSQAEKIYVTHYKKKKVKKWEKEISLIRLGIINYRKKNYKNSLIFLSKLYTFNKKTKYMPELLYFLSLSFDKLNKKQESIKSFKELKN